MLYTRPTLASLRPSGDPAAADRGSCPVHAQSAVTTAGPAGSVSAPGAKGVS